MSVAESSPWSCSFCDPPEPTAGASETLAAEFFHDLEQCIGGDLAPDEIVRFCRARAIEPVGVIRAIVRMRRGEVRWSAENITVTSEPEGWHTAEQAGMHPCCPVPSWRLGEVSANDKYVLHPCDSWWCESHGPPKAVGTLTVARFRFMNLDEVYYTVLNDNEAVIARMRSNRRPERGGGHSLLVGRDDGRLHVFATRAIACGRKGPRADEWVRLMPGEALERLAAALTLPGVTKVDWSRRWPAVPTGDDDADDRPPAEEAFIALPSVQAKRRAHAVLLATEEARQEFRLAPDEVFLPAEIMSPREWAERLGQAVARLRNRALWQRCVFDLDDGDAMEGGEAH